MNLKTIIALSACAAVTQVAFASFHEVIVSEVMTGANGNTAIQYVELEMEFAGENFFSGHHLKSFDATGTLIGDFTVPSDVASGATRKVLFATQAFANLGVVAPDFILPANFLSPASGQVSWADSAEVGGHFSYGSYTGSGINGSPASPNLNTDNKSLTRVANTGNDSADFQSIDNSPTNNANVTGHVSPPASVRDWSMY